MLTKFERRKAVLIGRIIKLYVVMLARKEPATILNPEKHIPL